MPQKLVAAMNETRLSSFTSEWTRMSGVAAPPVSAQARAALYAWQVSLSSAWYETLAYLEPVVRNSIDVSLRRWNIDRGHSADWLDDPAVPLAGFVGRAASTARIRAVQAKARRAPSHPRRDAPVSLDDRVAQLDFGNVVFLLPQDPPENRARRGSGFSGRENLWMHGLRQAFPRLTSDLMKSWRGHSPTGLPPEVEDGYAVGLALERLRRLRNRIGHHEQTFRVEHGRRLKDVSLLLRSVDFQAAVELKNLDRVRRVLALQPRP